MAVSPEDERLKALLERYLSGQCTDEERAEVDAWYDRYEQLPGKVPSAETLEELFPEIDARLPDPVPSGSPEAPSVRPWMPRKLWPAAAALALLLATVVLWRQASFRNTGEHLTVAEAGVYENDVMPGSDKAVLTLGDGSRIPLDSAGIKQLAAGQTFSAGEGLLEYETNQAAHTEALQYHTLSTPVGGQYRLKLPDGSLVWLNANSSIRFPSSFPPGERRVELSGEAYFEIAHLPSSPFRVSVEGRIDAEVLGTHFNIMAYDEEEAVYTTLAEGSLKVTNLREGGQAQGQEVLLRPGQQARTASATSILQVDPHEALAWKNGIISFNDADIKSIMRQLARWYDIEVEYAPGEFTRRFTGEVSRQAPLSEVLRILELSDIRFSLTDRTVKVFP